MKRKLAVLGGGNTGCIMAAEFSLRGFDVTLYEEKTYWHEHIDDILANNGVVEVIGQDLVGNVQLAGITDNLAEAIADTEAIFVSVVAWRHEALIEKLAGLLGEGHTVIFSAGNFASIRLRNRIGLDNPAVVGEMMGNIFPCRMVGPHTALIAGKLTEKMVAAFPGKDTGKLIEAVGQVFGCNPGKNVFETALNAPNVVVHLAGSLLNLGAVEKNPDFGLYNAGLTPSVIKCMKLVEKEKKAVMDCLGMKMVVHTDHMERVMDYGNHPQLDDFRSLKGPDSITHRYIAEDASCGDCLILSLADRLGIAMPVLRSLVTIASGLNGEDYTTAGITMEKLGVPGCTPEEINAYLESAK